MKTLAVVAKKGSAEAAVLARRLREHRPGLTLLADPEFARELGWPVHTVEEVAARALRTRQLRPDVAPIGDPLRRRHFRRKHGPEAYYGQTR